jgi:signal transduction histidine kinase
MVGFLWEPSRATVAVMNTATPFPYSELATEQNGRTTFGAMFEHAPIAVARCNPQGVITEMNPAFRRTLDCRMLDRAVASRQSLRLYEFVSQRDREQTESLLRDLLESRRESFDIEACGVGPEHSISKWTAWRQPGSGTEPPYALLVAERHVAERHTAERHTMERPTAAPPNDPLPAELDLLQTQRWEAIGRLAGGVVHDFNNLLTGVMLYCDLLLSSLDGRDRRRRYADEIRSATMQATGLVKQLLVFARPQATTARALCLNEIALAMRDLLTRLMGENIVLDLRLDPSLGLVRMDQAQAQQILLNLILNARDALTDGGRITVETSNCRFQTLAGTISPGTPTAFPCVLLVVGDNGRGMDAETRQRLFEPFFTTKNAGQGTGLGLTTVRSIVTSNRGLIHFESEPGHGTRVMILLPRASQPAVSNPLDVANPDSRASATTIQPIEKESLL